MKRAVMSYETRISSLLTERLQISSAKSKASLIEYSFVTGDLGPVGDYLITTIRSFRRRKSCVQCYMKFCLRKLQILSLSETLEACRSLWPIQDLQSQIKYEAPGFYLPLDRTIISSPSGLKKI